MASNSITDVLPDQTKTQVLLCLILVGSETEGTVYFQVVRTNLTAATKLLIPNILKILPIFRNNERTSNLLYDQNLRVLKVSISQRKHRLESCGMISQKQAHSQSQSFASKVMKDLMSLFSVHMQEFLITGARGALTLIF